MTERTRDYQLVIFDFDGTLVDSMGLSLSIYNELAAENGFTLVAEGDVAALRELSVIELLSELEIPKVKVPLLLREGLRRVRSQVSELALIEGVADLLDELSRRPLMLGILTSNSAENVGLFLEANHLREHFEFVSSLGRLRGKSKYLRSISRTFSVPPTQMLYVGDEIRDVEASRKAGVDSVAVTWGFNAVNALANAGPRYLIERPMDLLKILPPCQENE